jgi:hypothetical protein
MTGSAYENGMTATRGHDNYGGVTVTGRGHEGRQDQGTNNGLLASPMPREPSAARLKDQKPPQSYEGPRSFDSPTLFAFPLISLQEAAQRAAVRAHNGDDFTVTSGVRTRKNSSMDSSKATQRTTPPTPHLTKPIPAYSRRPSSASILGIPIADRGNYGYSQGT